MYSPYRALAWEQARSVMTLLACLYGMATVVHLALLTGVSGNVLSLHDARDSAIFASGLALLAAVASCLVRLNQSGHIDWGFEPRMARLPLETFPLVAIPYFLRCGSLALLAVALQLQHRFFFGDVLPTTLVLLPITACALSHAVLWGRTGLSGLSHLLWVAALLFLSGLLWRDPDAINFEAYLANMLESAATLPATFVAVLAGGVVSYVGVSLSRRGERRGPPELWQLWQRDRWRNPLPDVPHSSPLDAQLWLEWRRVGTTMPTGTFFGGLCIQGGLVTLLYFDADPLIARFILYGPYLALVMTCILVSGRLYPTPGLRSSRHQRFDQLRPSDDRLRAQAWMLTYARGLALSLPIAFALASLGWILAPGSEWNALYQGYLLGTISPLELAGVFSRPLLWSILAALIALTLSVTWTTGLLLGAWTCYFVHSVFELNFELPPYGIVILPIAIGTFLFESWRAWSCASVRFRTIVAAAAWVPVLTLALWANTYFMERHTLTQSFVVAVALVSVVAGCIRHSSRMRSY